MKIVTADHYGMCFGVRDAIALARSAAALQPITILGELVHNQAVLDSLRRDGVRMAGSLEEVATPSAMVTAHGASQKAIGAARARGLEVVEATCPLVHHAHRELARLVAGGCHPVVIGQRGHVEVRGMTEDLAACDVVLSEEEVDALAPRERFGVVAQTTQPVAKVRALVERLRQRFPQAEVRFSDTVCQPTKQRQRAAEKLAAACDVVVVVGGANSNNTRELAKTCGLACGRIHQVQGPEELSPEWFRRGDVAGLTAGTSTPDFIIAAVLAKLEAIAAGLERADSPRAPRDAEAACLSK